jgi:hypothetical protein
MNQWQGGAFARRFNFIDNELESDDGNVHIKIKVNIPEVRGFCNAECLTRYVFVVARNGGYSLWTWKTDDKVARPSCITEIGGKGA